MKNTIDNVSIGLRIRNARVSKSLSQEALAEAINLDRTTITYIELGEKCPSLETLINIANVLEVSTDDLLLDNLDYSSSDQDTDIHYLLLDCSLVEKKFLTKVLVSIKDILRNYKIQ